MVPLSLCCDDEVCMFLSFLITGSDIILMFESDVFFGLDFNRNKFQIPEKIFMICVL